MKTSSRIGLLATIIVAFSGGIFVGRYLSQSKTAKELSSGLQRVVPRANLVQPNLRKADPNTQQPTPGQPELRQIDLQRAAEQIRNTGKELVIAKRLENTQSSVGAQFDAAMAAYGISDERRSRYFESYMKIYEDRFRASDSLTSMVTTQNLLREQLKGELGDRFAEFELQQRRIVGEVEYSMIMKDRSLDDATKAAFEPYRDVIIENVTALNAFSQATSNSGASAFMPVPTPAHPASAVILFDEQRTILKIRSEGLLQSLSERNALPPAALEGLRTYYRGALEHYDALIDRAKRVRDLERAKPE